MRGWCVGEDGAGAGWVGGLFRWCEDCGLWLGMPVPRVHVGRAAVHTEDVEFRAWCACSVVQAKGGVSVALSYGTLL